MYKSIRHENNPLKLEFSTQNQQNFEEDKLSRLKMVFFLFYGVAPI